MLFFVYDNDLPLKITSYVAMCAEDKKKLIVGNSDVKEYQALQGYLRLERGSGRPRWVYGSGGRSLEDS